MKRVFITGTAGFIGFHLARLLLNEGFSVHGFDGLTDYYDVRLKTRRHQILKQMPNFAATEAMLEDETTVMASIKDFAPDILVHLAGQAGVRYSLEAPRSYIESNIVGTFNVMEAAHAAQVDHLMMASSSSVYGANHDLPFAETHKADLPLTIYAATKKANEAMGHSYAHLHGLPVTMFRFFTIYGPWGRPDMALFKFTDKILKGEPIDIYNRGEMYRDFTYVDDLVRGIRLLMDVPPPSPDTRPDTRVALIDGDSLSPAAPFRVVNIGNSEKVRLLDFVETLENRIGRKAIRNYMPMQPGDLPATWADASLLESLTGYTPQTGLKEGVAAFVDWFRDYYRL